MWTLFFVFVVCLRCGAVEVAADVSADGRAELHRVRNLAAQPRYGECWSRALENIEERCREFTADMQSRLALRFTHCHLHRSGRSFPACPEGSDVSTCTRTMDPVAFNSYTEFFTHAHSICHYLQSESWQHQAETTIHRLLESSAGVVEKLSSTQRMAEDLVEAQSAALQSQEKIIRNGEELKHILHHSTQGLRSVFDEMKHTAQEQQVAFSEIFNRVAFLQSFIMSESHTLTSLLYNSLGFLAAFFLTATQRTAPARFLLFGLVVLNVYLERMICRAVLDSSEPGYQQMARISMLVGLLRRFMVLVGLLVLCYSAVRYQNVTKESLEILRQIKETRTSLQLALHQAESLSEAVGRRSRGRRPLVQTEPTCLPPMRTGSMLMVTRTEFCPTTHRPTTHRPTTHRPHDAPPHDAPPHDAPPHDAPPHDTQPSPGRRRQRRSSISRRTSSSPLVYSILVEDEQTGYNLRRRRSSVLLAQD
ncbi:hypothetical protein UPYG_G00001440 [Umbra pygmaea]|uniref:Protein brambleberry-like n=1 Tax=Umbra pygmaea TaxID=75934 RepID=A0ABD0Y0P3_UMBPY